MAHFTQLGLSGEPDRKPENKTIRTNSGAAPRNPRKFSGGQKTAAVICSLVATSLLGVSLLETSGCSKGSNKSAGITPPTQTAPSPMPSTAASTQEAAPATAAAEKKPAHKTSRQRTLLASNYTNPLYGVSFRYPKNYSLQEGDKANLEWAALKPVQMNFVQPGGTTLTMVELPNRQYPGTDFASAFFTLSVNTNLTAATCGQFASPDKGHAEASPSPDGTAPAAPAPTAEPSKVKLGAAEFTEVENSGGETAKDADAKYYHVFQNNTCYEFTLGLETAKDGTKDGVKPVDRTEVFRKLNWMLSTVKIQPAGVPAVAAQAPSAPAAGGKD